MRKRYLLAESTARGTHLLPVTNTPTTQSRDKELVQDREVLDARGIATLGGPCGIRASDPDARMEQTAATPGSL